MGKLFVAIYDYFERRRALLWTLLVLTVVGMSIAAVHVRYVENITSFFPKSGARMGVVFDHLRVKDKLVVMCTRQTSATTDEALESCADTLVERFAADSLFGRMATMTAGIDDNRIGEMTRFVYEHLPLLMTDADYARLDSLTSPEAVHATMQRNYENLLSPIGGFISDYVGRDPLGIGAPVLKELQRQAGAVEYQTQDGYIFSADRRTLMLFIEPHFGNESSESEQLVEAIERIIAQSAPQFKGIDIDYFGAPAVAAYNARQIKHDTALTLSIALLIIVVFLSLAFRNKWSILLVITPVIYGGLFALAGVWLFAGEISLIAVGSGSIIFGLALSYSIHMLSHTNHCSDMRQLILDLAEPLTIGSFTTIGAFVGLLFTDSRLLQDFGLFAALTLIGTTLFALIFLPHFIRLDGESAPRNPLLVAVDRIASSRPDRNRVLVWSILLLTLVCSFFSTRVGFDSNMMNLNYEPAHLKRAELRLKQATNKTDSLSSVIFAATDSDTELAVGGYERLCRRLDSLQKAGRIASYGDISRFVVPDSVQRERLLRWQRFWTSERRTSVERLINGEAVRLGFEEGMFDDFYASLGNRFQPIDYAHSEEVTDLFADWFSAKGGQKTFLAQVKMSAGEKLPVYERFAGDAQILAVDRAFFAGKMAEEVNNNFYLILMISSLLTFFALLISYGRIELTLMSFLPMCVSWFIILGLMAMLGVKFNIVTIILSSFIFGIGDDFSIFIMDGLQSQYRNRRPLLPMHKMAIFFSSFTILVGMGTLVLARHPALYPLGVLSLVGIGVVVLVAYTVQPLLFRWFISSQTDRGEEPYTLRSALFTAYSFGLFVTGCGLIHPIMVQLWLLPVSRKRRKLWLHKLVRWSTDCFLSMTVVGERVIRNRFNERFDRPAVVVANHQSFIDILVMLSLHAKFVMVTKGWVWRSPFFGRIVRGLDGYSVDAGYEHLAYELRKRVAEGYSIVVFPEGSRSKDRKVHRFHKGAFLLAQQLGLEVVPVVLYGNGLKSSKRQPFYIKRGTIVADILERQKIGTDCCEEAHRMTALFRERYHALYEEFNRAGNLYFHDALLRNYIYKGPVVEWYMRVKFHMEGWYDLFDRLLPREGSIVDLGCGYGPLPLMLDLLSNRRRILGVGYDEEKIAVADNCYSKSERLTFRSGDIRTVELPDADAFVMNDVLHYMDPEAQRGVVARCARHLLPNGVILLRDGDRSQQAGQAVTERTERWSTRILHFNKTDGALHFLSTAWVEQLAAENGLQCEIVHRDHKTSNTVYRLTRRSDV